MLLGTQGFVNGALAVSRFRLDVPSVGMDNDCDSDIPWLAHDPSIHIHTYLNPPKVSKMMAQNLSKALILHTSGVQVHIYICIYVYIYMYIYIYIFIYSIIYL